MGNHHTTAVNERQRLWKRHESSDSGRLNLTDVNVRLARVQWKNARAHHHHLGCKLLVNFLGDYPSYTAKFHVAGERDRHEHNGMLQFVGAKIVAFLTSFIDSAENEQDNTRAQCRTLGRMHFYRDVSFDHEMFEAFKQHILALIFSTPANQQRRSSCESEEEQRLPWQLALDYVIREIMHGIVHESVAKQILQPRRSDTSDSSEGNSVSDTLASSHSASYLSLNNIFLGGGIAAGADSPAGNNGRRTPRPHFRAKMSKLTEAVFTRKRPEADCRKTSDSLFLLATNATGSGKAISQKKRSASTEVSPHMNSNRRHLSQSRPRSRKKSESGLTGGEPPSPSLLSWDERELLRKMWAAANPETIGQEIIIDLFESKPELRTFFGLSTSQDINLYDNVIVKVHGCRMHGFLDNLIQLILGEKMARAVKITERVGQLHYHRGVQFTADKWLAFKSTIIKHIVKGLPNNADITTAYVVVEKMLRFVTSHMKQGFLAMAMDGKDEFGQSIDVLYASAAVASDLQNIHIDHGDDDEESEILL